jgi:exopolysaccharide biosynthesis WecB/TagA/CpsF family protein
MLMPRAIPSAVCLLDLNFANFNVGEAAACIAARDPDGPFDYVVTPNADHLVRIRRSSRLHAIYRDSALCLLDSRVVNRLARVMGCPAPKVTPGSDLTAVLLDQHLQPGEQITIVGLSPAWVPELVKRCRLAPPAHYDPPMGFERDSKAFDATIEFVRANPSRFIFLAVGSPRQEYLAAAIATGGGATGTGLCIGASLEFLAGARMRAPRLICSAGLEWLFRLATNPRRLFRRYVIDSPQVFALLLKQRLAGARSSRELRV